MPVTNNQGLVPSQRSNSHPAIRPATTAANNENPAAYARPDLRLISSLFSLSAKAARAWATSWCASHNFLALRKAKLCANASSSRE